ncbi:hypothetical protein Bbelb_317790 [Branchiostoma belcheri]|nr:hypothetical protein Bbelb_317790 [Branchiostoma belcheri]
MERERDVSGIGMTDVYDGKVWNEFQYVNGTPFLTEPNNLALMLNCDWYQPYKHSEYSVGVLYLVVLNLPREERFKEENMIVVGLIPGPKEPKIDINSFLEPLVDELQDLWKGVLLSDNSVLGAQLYRAALVCLSSDIPAARKCGGFVGHGALRGCSKCLRMFTRSRFGTKADYSGFDRTVWPLRTSSDHVRFAKMGRRAKSKAERKRVEDRYGARWSELFRLPYYDAVRFVVIDPMHNLLLGTSKHVFKVWVDLGVLNRKAFDVIQSRIDSMKVPSDVGRIPRKIASGFSGFTADQWKNWTCIYSLFCLKGLIDSRHYDMWYEFVQACRLLCSRVISYENLLDADNHLQRFLAMFEEISAPQHTPSVRGVNFRAHARRARIRECKEISGAVHAEPGNPWTRPGHGEFHGCVRAWKLLETWVFVQWELLQNDDARAGPTRENTDESTRENTNKSTRQNTDEPTRQNTNKSTRQNTDESTRQNTDEPTRENTNKSTRQNTDEPTRQNTDESTRQNTDESTRQNTDEPTRENTNKSTQENTDESTQENTDEPTRENTDEPTRENTDEPTQQNTDGPTRQNTDESK